jgi:CHAT domain-containing protein
MFVQRASGRSRRRLHWYPFGDFSRLPLHAAGIYEGPNQVCVSDFVVSSYAPSLSSITKAREDFTPIPSHTLRGLIVAEAEAPGLPVLTGVREESHIVAELLASASANVLNDIDVVQSKSPVLAALPSAHVLHLSCHGIQDEDALKSRFALREDGITVSDLMQLNLPNATLAFLGACETAKGDEDEPDQAVHLAASMLFCGFRSVIGTMW